MQRVYPKIADADILILATPVYVDGMTGLMKILLDRMIPLLEGPFEIRDEHCRHPLRERVKKGKLVLVSTCGFTEMDNFEPLVIHVKAACQNMGREYGGALLRPHGWFMRELKRRGYPVEKVTNTCKDAGRQMILEGKISQDLQKEVSQDFVAREQVLKYNNSFYG
jgi:multimeric flavodoxin WrbA